MGPPSACPRSLRRQREFAGVEPAVGMPRPPRSSTSCAACRIFGGSNPPEGFCRGYAQWSGLEIRSRVARTTNCNRTVPIAAGAYAASSGAAAATGAMLSAETSSDRFAKRDHS